MIATGWASMAQANGSESMVSLSHEATTTTSSEPIVNELLFKLTLTAPESSAGTLSRNGVTGSRRADVTASGEVIPSDEAATALGVFVLDAPTCQLIPAEDFVVDIDKEGPFYQRPRRTPVEVNVFDFLEDLSSYCPGAEDLEHLQQNAMRTLEPLLFEENFFPLENLFFLNGREDSPFFWFFQK